MRELLRLPLQREKSAFAAEVELAIRLWSRNDSRALTVLEEVDALRLRYIENLLVNIGIDKGLARAHAILSYSYMRVAPTLIGSDAVALMQQCENLIIGKRSR